MQGKADYKPIPGMEDRLYFIGDVENPIYACKRKEVQELFTDEFYLSYNLWNYFHNKVLPEDFNSWGEINPDIMTNILEMENYFNARFSTGNVIIKYLDAIFRVLKMMGGFK